MQVLSVKYERTFSVDQSEAEFIIMFNSLIKSHAIDGHAEHPPQWPKDVNQYSDRLALIQSVKRGNHAEGLKIEAP